MHPLQDPILSRLESVSDALARLENTSNEFFLVGDGYGKWRGITKDTLRQAASKGDGEETIASVLRGPPLPHVHPDHALDIALRRIGTAPFLPVVHRAGFTKLEGIASLKDILETYRKAH